MEYGLSPDLPIYAGGLGILAGDTLKSAGDLELPITGIGIFWHHGYATQVIGDSGRQEDRWDPVPRDALVPLDVELSVTIAGREVPLRAFRVEGHTRAKLYLLEPAASEDRWITRSLYGGGVEDRVAQEIVLGVGGVRLLTALGEEPQVYHFNEGHAVFAGLELVQRECEAGAPVKDAIARVRQRIVFTTHTPVAAGNEKHEIDLLVRMNADRGLGEKVLRDLGGSPFNMTEAGLRLASRANAVAQLHGETAREMWKYVQGGAPIQAITNGIHLPSWQDRRVTAALEGGGSPEERRGSLWSAHQSMKGELLAAIRERTGQELAEDRLLLGFARRAAPYKRADLIFGDADVVERLFADRRVQLVFAGKSHPANEAGKAIVARLVEASRRWPDNVVFLPDYDMEIGALLTRGCDVWLNNPRRPLEASGTSGMKAAANGVLNFSILDGWWPEGCVHGENGWRIREPDAHPLDEAELDRRDREALYQVLEGEVMQRYYEERDRWVEMMTRSVEMAQERFSSDRMVREYYGRLYTS